MAHSDSDLALRTSVERWLLADPDPDSQRVTRGWLDSNDHDSLRSAFGERLQFGTAGLRGVIGPGPNRMNRALTRYATAGLADYLIATVDRARELGVVVGHDARRGSPEFAAEAASVLRGAGFRVWVLPPQSPTPLVAFALLEYSAAAGIMVTASHNPPEYNGYKVYWGNGAQIIPPHDFGIAAAIDEVITSGRPIPVDVEGTIAVGPEIEAAYLAAVTRQAAYIPLPASTPRIAVVYTPLHGVGAHLCEPAMAAEGADVVTVPSQRAPDGGFPTVRFPNPEEPGALDLSEALLLETEAAVLVANDPDADRLAICVRVAPSTGPAAMRRLSGDELGAIFADALLEARGKERNIAEDAFVGRSLVSSELLTPIAQFHGARALETLTGFKWLWNAALEQIALGGTYVFAYEEALGYSVGPVARDKDGIGAAATLVRIARSGDLLARLYAIYERHGYYGTRQKSVADASPGGLLRLQGRVNALRLDPPSQVAGLPVARTRDFQKSEQGLPPSEGVGLWLEDGTRLLVRPSGTEPKIKVYTQVVEPWREGAESRAGERITVLENAVVALLTA